MKSRLVSRLQDISIGRLILIFGLLGIVPLFLLTYFGVSFSNEVVEEVSRSGATVAVQSQTARILAVSGLLLILLVGSLFFLAFVLKERKRSEELLIEATRSANKANEMKNEFLSRMSHELRTPLNAILGFSQLLQMDELTPDQKESVEEITRGGGHLLELINEVLDISRIESGRLAVSMEPVSLGLVLSEVVTMLQPFAESHQVKIVQPHGSAQTVLADRQRLKQILINLLSNGIKYNRPGGALTIALESDGAREIVRVRDTGDGVPEAKQELLFAPFERLGAEATSTEGTGLGLTLSKTLAEAMRGSLSQRNIPGGGAEFELVLQSPQVADDLEAMDNLKPIATKTCDVLYVEDNLSNLRLIELLLTKRPGTRLATATRGSEGIAMARSHLPNVILLDLHLPDMTGEDVLESFKRDARTASIPVFVISAGVSEGQSHRLRERGADAFLGKPIDPKEFYRLVDGALLERRIMQDAR